MSRPSIDLFAGLDRRPVLGTPSQRAGLYYERKVCEWFERRFLCARQPAVRWPGRWPKVRYPDLLVFRGAKLQRCVVVEVKHQFVESSVWQVEEYAQAVREAYPFCAVYALIICEQVLESVDLPLVSVQVLDYLLLEHSLSLGVLTKRELRMDRLNGLDCAAPGAIREPGSVGNCLRSRSELPGMAAEA